MIVRPTRNFRPNAFGFGLMGDMMHEWSSMVGVLGGSMEEDQSVAGSRR